MTLALSLSKQPRAEPSSRRMASSGSQAPLWGTCRAVPQPAVPRRGCKEPSSQPPVPRGTPCRPARCVCDSRIEQNQTAHLWHAGFVPFDTLQLISPSAQALDMLIKRPVVDAVKEGISGCFSAAWSREILFAFMLHLKADPYLQPSSPFP